MPAYGLVRIWSCPLTWKAQLLGEVCVTPSLVRDRTYWDHMSVIWPPPTGAFYIPQAILLA